jgi:hypothetical protein
MTPPSHIKRQMNLKLVTNQSSLHSEPTAIFPSNVVHDTAKVTTCGILHSRRPTRNPTAPGRKPATLDLRQNKSIDSPNRGLRGDLQTIQELPLNLGTSRMSCRKERSKIASTTLSQKICVVGGRSIADGSQCSGEGPAEVEGDSLEIIGSEVHAVVDDEVVAWSSSALECDVRLEVEVEVVRVADGRVVDNETCQPVPISVNCLENVSFVRDEEISRYVPIPLSSSHPPMGRSECDDAYRRPGV